MTIPTSWREAYQEQKALAERLVERVRVHLQQSPKGWYVESRVKAEPSFYEKIETGNVPDFKRLEDFVGALIVVPMRSNIVDALRFVESFFTIEYRRPKSDLKAEHRADSFPFTDIRLYGRLQVDEAMPPSPLDEMLFEIQVKTFFQHAWATTTHDLVYKYDSFSWNRSRVAAQVKAILEHAEMSIEAIDHLQETEALRREGEPEQSLNRYLEVLTSHWSRDYLPDNTKRMAETIAALCGALGLDPEALDALLQWGSAELDGHPDGWSPYQCVVEYASRETPERLLCALRKTGERERVVHVTPEVLIRLGVKIDTCPNARL